MKLNQDPPGPSDAPHHKDEAAEHMAVSAAVVHEAIRREGEHQLHRTLLALLFSGLAAGLAMGFSGVAEALLRSHLPDEPWRDLIAKLGYPVGFLLVIFGRQQLFTENTLKPVIPLLTSPSARMLGLVARLWAIVLLANLLGAALFAWAATRLDVFSPDVRHALLEIGRKSTSHDPAGVFWRGIFAGWLIALMVWMLPAGKHKISIIVIVTYVVGIAGLSHIIAGTVDTLALVFEGQLPFGRWLTGWTLPTLIGNVVGGVLLVAVLNHAQVAADKSNGPP